MFKTFLESIMHSGRRRGAILAALLAIPAALFASSASALPTQLGFAIDGSGSINGTEFATQRSGLANAFGALPTDSSVEITVVQFASGAQLEVAPLLIDSVATRNALVTAVQGIGQTGGGTVPETAIDLLTAQMTASANFGGDSIINLSTDGGFFLPPAVTSATNAKAAGIDALTAEAIGSGASTSNLLDMVFNPFNAPGVNSQLLATDASPPNPLTNPAWVVPVSSFAAFGPVVQAKIQAVTGIPTPGTLGLMVFGLIGAGLAMRGRRSVKPAMA